ncbi:CHAT domain-containing tetratricopeptide repeat protein [Pseudoxanthomonas sp. 10H]|uniref:CHAT domain-containing tetratricopeptide repeat protein n=1 Tax=Pseudoxanthomonas sp. 10H TaxID=3242729 RepID=UPI003558080E
MLDFSNPGAYPPAIRAFTDVEAAALAQRMEAFAAAVDAVDLAQAHDLGDALVAMLDASYGPAHPLRAEVAGIVGWGYVHAGDPVAAIALLKPAVEVLDRAHGSFNPPARMAARALLAAMLQADDQAAARAMLDSWPLVRLSGHGVNRLDGDSDVDYASDLEVAATYAQAYGMPEWALEMRREVLASREATMGAESVGTAQALDLLAVSLLQYGLADEAEPLASRSLAIREARYGAQSYPAAASLATLGRIRAARGRTAEGESMLRRALQLHRERLGDANPLSEEVSAALARMLVAQGRHQEAVGIWGTLVAARAQRGVAGPRTLDILLGLADSAEALGACEAVGGLLDRMASDAGDAMWIPALTGLRIHEAHARNLYCRGDHARAAREYETAAYGLLGLFDASHPEFGLMQARMALLVGRDDATLDKAESAAGNAVFVANERRHLLHAGGSAAARALAGRGGADPMALAYQAQLYVSWRRLVAGNPMFDQGWAGEPTFAGTYRNEGFVAAQDFDHSGAARALAQTAARAAAGSGALAAQVRRQQDLAGQAIALDRQLAEAVAADPAAAAGLRARFAEVIAELGAVDKALAAGFPEYAQMAMPRALPVRDVQSKLAGDEGLLLLVPVAADVHVFAVSAAGVAWHRLEGRADDVARQVGALRCQLDPATCGEAAADGSRGVASVYGQATAQGGRGFDRGIAHALYRDLVAPVEGVLVDTACLFVVASGPLGGLPLGVLVTEAPQAGEDDASTDVLARTAWLADRYAMVTLPAVSSLQPAVPAGSAAVPGGAATTFLGFGAPVLAGGAGAVRGGGPVFAVADGDGLGLADPATIRALAPLPGTRRELDAMAALFGAGANVATGAGATEAAFKRSPRVRDAAVLAFATHGLLPREVRGLDEPGLVFTPPAQASREDDGVLTASEVAGLELRADWLILSACNTAAADGTPGAASLSGLARAFLYAGAQSLLASHWRVSDDATAALTVETLSAWRAPAQPTRSRALQQAMRTVRSGQREDGTPLPGWKPQWAHPSAWAPFVLIAAGDR